MAVMVFLKSAADISLLFMLLGPIAVHFGARPLMCVITFAVTALSQVLSFEICLKKDKLRLMPYILPLFCIFLPGRCVAWAVLCGLILAYEVFTGVTRRYMPDDSVQKTIFKISLGLIAAMLVILLIASAVQRSFTIVILSGMITASCSILLMRSLRHEPEVYGRFSYQVVNLGIMAGVAALAAVISSGPVLKGIFTAVRTVYLGIAYAVMFLLNYLIRILAWIYRAIRSLFSGNISPPPEQEVPQINTESIADMFPGTENNSPPQWLRMIFIILGVLILLLIIALVFMKLAGRRAEAMKAVGVTSQYSPAIGREEKRRFTGQVQGVRKQYRKYLGMVEKEGVSVGPEDTSEDVCTKAHSGLGGAAARELRQLYIDARYNGTASRAAAERAKELVRELKKAKTDL